MHRPELVRYYPYRFRESRDYFPALYNDYRKCPLRGDGVMSLQDFQRLHGRLAMEFWNRRLDTVPLELRPRNTNRLMEESTLFYHTARFNHCGRNIFHISPVLTALLRLTEVDDVQWGAIQLPYSFFYLWFGPQPDWTLRNSTFRVDGAYIGEAASPEGKLVEVLLTTVSEGPQAGGNVNYVSTPDPYYYFPFEVGDPASTVSEAFRSTLEGSDDFNEDFPRAEAPDDVIRRAALAGKTIKRLPREKTAQAEKVRGMLLDLPTFRETLRLVVNCLCYLSSPSREVEARYPDSGVRRGITQPVTPLERARAEKRAIREGYTLVHFCGDSLERGAHDPPTGRELSAHWRRGHWRNQAVGTGRSEHKLIWVRPTLVRKDKAAEGVPGHVYDVDQSR